MGKSTNLFKIALGIGGAITAVALSRKESRTLKTMLNVSKVILKNF